MLIHSLLLWPAQTLRFPEQKSLKNILQLVDLNGSKFGYVASWFPKKMIHVSGSPNLWSLWNHRWSQLCRGPLKSLTLSLIITYSWLSPWCGSYNLKSHQTIPPIISSISHLLTCIDKPSTRREPIHLHTNQSPNFFVFLHPLGIEWEGMSTDNRHTPLTFFTLFQFPPPWLSIFHLSLHLIHLTLRYDESGKNHVNWYSPLIFDTWIILPRLST